MRPINAQNEKLILNFRFSLIFDLLESLSCAFKFIGTHRTNGIDISISDNGIGFDAKTKRNQNSLGLKTIAERIRILQGQLQIKSQPNIGTTINIQISTPS